jgi:FG-GAP repeat
MPSIDSSRNALCSALLAASAIGTGGSGSAVVPTHRQVGQGWVSCASLDLSADTVGERMECKWERSSDLGTLSAILTRSGVRLEQPDSHCSLEVRYLPSDPSALPENEQVLSRSTECIRRSWDEGISEQFEWLPNGLEHTITLATRTHPANSKGVCLPLRVAVPWHHAIDPDSRGITFAVPGCHVGFRYDGLKVFDAIGCELPARFSTRNQLVEIQIDDQDAQYPIIVDPLIYPVAITAFPLTPLFGISVSRSGDTIVVGSPIEQSACTGVNCNPFTSGTITGSGAAYVYLRSGNSWTRQAYLKASNTDMGDQFGAAVAISGDTIVVAAPFEASSATTIDGNQLDNSASGSGAAYVFVRTSGAWSQQAYLKASNAQAGDGFGHSVAISGDTILIGAWAEDSSAIGVNGNQFDNTAVGAGAAYVFRRSGSTWVQEAYLKASNTGSQDLFGYAVAIDQDTVVVGAAEEDSSANTVNGNGLDNSLSNAGAAYVYERSANQWTFAAYLKPPNPDSDDLFGASVGVSGDTIVVGAPYEASNASGVNGNPNDNSFGFSGAAYVFTGNGSTWSQQAYLKASNPDAFDSFGWSVAISQGRVVVGAKYEHSTATGIDGNQLNNSGNEVGAAYDFVLEGGLWSQRHYLKPLNTFGPVHFGIVSSVDADSAVIGTQGGNVAYAFDLDTLATVFCSGDGTATLCPCANVGASGSGCANSISVDGARLVSRGTARVAADTIELISSGTGAGAGVFLQGTLPDSGGTGQMFGDGLLCAAGAVSRLAVKFPVGGTSMYPDGGGTDQPVSVAGTATPGSTRYYQHWYRDGLSFCTSATFNLTNGISVTWR